MNAIDRLTGLDNLGAVLVYGPPDDPTVEVRMDFKALSLVEQARMLAAMEYRVTALRGAIGDRIEGTDAGREFQRAWWEAIEAIARREAGEPES